MLLSQRTVTIKLKRYEVFRLMTACTIIADTEMLDEDSRQRWINLHQKLSEQLLEFDKRIRRTYND